MTHPQTVKQYRKFFEDLGISHLDIKEKYGDLRKRGTWEKAYDDYTYPNLPIIKAINEAIAQKAIPVISKPATVCVAKVIEALEVLEFVESFSTLEEKPGLIPFLETYDNLYKSMIICSIPASIWQRRRYPVHRLSRSN